MIEKDFNWKFKDVVGGRMLFCKKCFISAIVLFILFGSSLVVLVNAEPSWVMWSKTFGGTDYDQAYSLVKTSDGGYVIAGRTWSFGAGGSDFWLIRTNEQGVPEFPSWTILPLFLIASLVIILYRNRLRKKVC